MESGNTACRPRTLEGKIITNEELSTAFHTSSGGWMDLLRSSLLLRLGQSAWRSLPDEPGHRGCRSLAKKSCAGLQVPGWLVCFFRVVHSFQCLVLFLWGRSSKSPTGREANKPACAWYRHPTPGVPSHVDQHKFIYSESADSADQRLIKVKASREKGNNNEVPSSGVQHACTPNLHPVASWVNQNLTSRS